MRTALLVLVMVGLSLVFACGSSAAAVQWSQNGHWYEAVAVVGALGYGITWGEAQTLALNSGGYLATVTSADENNFIYGLISSGDKMNSPFWWYSYGDYSWYGPWIGGYRTGTEDWAWDETGEEWSYTNWAAGRPDNFYGNEDHLHFFELVGGPAGTWNDADWTVRGYIVEYDPVPIPPTVWLLGPGLIGLVRLRRRFRK